MLDLSQVLTFRLGEEFYGLDILNVQEIRGCSQVTRIPQSPGHVLGVLNLRGSVVPIIDMRLLFGQARADFTPLTVIIVVSVNIAGIRRDCGLVVDTVADVVDLVPGCIRTAPHLDGGSGDSHILGLATLADRILILLDVNHLVAQTLPALSVAECA
jgi:purine-binding chemotaxis protein CheW